MIDFVGIGVNRCGTTWTTNNLKKHPAVFIPIKEARYFMFNDYKAVLPQAKSKIPKRTKLFGEWTPIYFMQFKKVAQRILAANPDVKLLLNLRNPVDRAWSWYKLRIKNKRIPQDASFLDLFYESGSDNSYRVAGYYQRHLLKWADLFPVENFHISIFDEMKSNQVGHLNHTARFLGIKARYEESNLWGPNKASRESTSGPIPPRIRAELAEHYAPHVKAVRELLVKKFKMDVSGWEWK